MQQQALWDLSPAIHIMLMGVAVALGPLAWVLLRKLEGGSARRLQALTLLTLFLTFDLVLFGAFTRLTDSGLGCPDWPGCYGNASPFGARHDIAMAQAVQSGGAPTTVLRVPREALAAWLAASAGDRLEAHMAIVDPMGDWMMRVPGDPDPAKLKRDIERLLRASAS